MLASRGGVVATHRSCRIPSVARFEFHQDPPPPEGIERAERVLNLVVRCFGLVLMVVGLIVALSVIFSAWITLFISSEALPAGCQLPKPRLKRLITWWR